MGNDVLVLAGIELVKVLIRGALEFAKVMQLPSSAILEEFEKEKAKFLANDPANLPDLD